MYKDAKTWNPFKGCLFDCTYCEPSFKAINRRIASCKDCQDYVPHEHPERYDRIPDYPIVFVCGNGDITFAGADVLEKILTAMWRDYEKRPDRTFYLQSKNPAIFHNPPGPGYPPNTVLGTTLETNRSEGYDEVSSAPCPTTRAALFRQVDWPRKYVTVEPVMAFDLSLFNSTKILSLSFCQSVLEQIIPGGQTQPA